MAEKKSKNPPAAGGDQDAKIAGLEAKISELSAQLEAALKKKQVDPELVQGLTDRINSLEEKLEQAEKLAKLELPKDPPEDDPEKGKKSAGKKKPEESDSGVGMFS